jgi:hypothetical protein
MVVIDHVENTYARFYRCEPGLDAARGSVAAACGTTDAETDGIIDGLLSDGWSLEAITSHSPGALEDLIGR